MKDESAFKLREWTKLFRLRFVKIFVALPKTDEARVLGKQVLRSGTKETANLGGNFFLPALHARQSVLSKTGSSLSTLLAEPQIQAALK